VCVCLSVSVSWCELSKLFVNMSFFFSFLSYFLRDSCRFVDRWPHLSKLNWYLRVHMAH
jgi:hypothetical protein